MAAPLFVHHSSVGLTRVENLRGSAIFFTGLKKAFQMKKCFSTTQKQSDHSDLDDSDLNGTHKGVILKSCNLFTPQDETAPPTNRKYSHANFVHSTAAFVLVGDQSG